MKLKNKAAYFCLMTLIMFGVGQKVSFADVAGTSPLVDVDFTGLPEGPLTSAPNNGTLGGVVDARGAEAEKPTIGSAYGGSVAALFDGNDYLQLAGSEGGALIVPPAGIVGAAPTRSIEVWVVNPAIADEETMVAWGKRGGGFGSNMSFNYGSNGSFGAVGHWGSSPDIGWVDAGGAPASNEWHHLVYTHDGTTTRVYSDGVLVNSEGGFTLNTHAGTSILIGAQLESDGTAVTVPLRASMAIGAVRIWDDVMSDDEVAAAYNAEVNNYENPSPVERFVVAGNATAAAPYTNWLTAAATIQDAVDVAFPGDTVIVTNGVYGSGSRAYLTTLPARVVITNAITVKSVNGPEVTRIEGYPERGPDAVRCVYLGENANAVLSGFTLADGAGLTSGDIFRDMSAGGVYSALYSSSVVTNCILTGHSGVTGGAAVGGTLINCTLTNNFASNWGGATRGSDLINCLVVSNRAGLAGGGAYQGTLINSTVVGNSAVNDGGGTYAAYLTNCIVYFNTAPANPNHGGSIGVNYTVGYTCTTPLPASGVGNISSDPQFEDYPGGNYRLLVSSLCVNAGDNAAVIGATDLDSNPRLVGGVADMGAYETAWVTVSVVTTDGTTTGGGNYLPGENLLISARSLNAHWTFSSWNDGSTDISRTITVPTVVITYTASFTESVGPLTTYVSAANPTPLWPHTSWATAATNIQDAVDAAADGDTVLVNDGVYASGGRARGEGTVTNRVVITNAITVRSVNGPQVTIIEGAGPIGPSAVRCAYLGADATLSGFTLANGATGDFSSSDRDGGGALCSFDAVLTNCVVTGNTADGFGGGVSGGVLYHCVLSDNLAASQGGGVYAGRLSNCLLTGNRALSGGGASSGSLTNCTIVGNSASGEGGGSNGGSFYNSILYFNTAPQDPNHYFSTFNSSCTTPLPASGVGNISSDPQFVDYAGGNYRLSLASPCVDTGDTDAAVGSIDLDGNPRLVGGAADMGAYESGFVEVTAVAINGTTTGSGTYLTGENVDISARGLNAHWVFSAWDDGDTNITRTITAPITNITYTAMFNYNSNQITAYAAAGNATPQWPYTSWETAARTIQEAIDAVDDGDIVIVADGYYDTGGRTVGGEAVTNLVVITNAITVTSLRGPEFTTITPDDRFEYPQQGTRCAYVGANAVLSGFSLTGGDARWGAGGGAYCETGATITNCFISSNRALDGGGCYGGTLIDCRLVDNVSISRGGGSYESILIDCDIINNRADNDGGGCYGGMLTNCTLIGNESEFADGGGSYRSILNNCVVSANHAGHYGGGSYQSTLNNCTVTGNEAGDAGGGCYLGTIRNTIVYFNFVYDSYEFGTENWYEVTAQRSCTSPVPPGTGNIDSNPLFVNASNSDFRLRYGSPCVDAASSLAGITSGLNGTPRPIDGNFDGVAAPDMGAYEYDPMSEDSDDDGLTDSQEHFLGFNPLVDSSAGVAYGGSIVTNNPAAYGLYTPDSIQDLSMGYLMIQTSNGFLRLQLQLEQAPDPISGAWTNAGDAVEWIVPAGEGKAFYRVRGAP